MRGLLVTVIVGWTIARASADTMLVNVATDHAAGAAAIASLRAEPAETWRPSRLAPARGWLEDAVTVEGDPHVRARTLIDDAGARFLEFDFAGAITQLDAAERAFANATFAPTSQALLRDLNVRRAEVELAAGRPARADAWLRLAIRLGATALDSKRFPPAVRTRHRRALAAERAASRRLVTIATVPPGAARCVDGSLLGAPAIELVGGEHYVCAASPGFRPRFERMVIRGDRVTFTLDALPPDEAARRLRAELATAAPAEARDLARTLAKLAGADRLLLVRGSDIQVFDLASDRLEPWSRAARVEPAAPHARPLVDPPARGGAPSRPWYRNKWLIVAGVAVAVTAGIVVVTWDAKDTYRSGGFQWTP